MSETRVSPHGFKPLRRFRNKGRCGVCLLHEHHHGRGLPNWPLARAVGDKRPPESWEKNFPDLATMSTRSA